jgi:TatD DNase family protein
VTLRLTDAHAHLDGDSFGEDLDAVIARAREAGLERIVLIGLWRSEGNFGNALDLARRDPGLFSATVGIHPHEAVKVPESDWALLEALARDPLVRGVGETGLDFHYDFSPRPVQIEAFRRSIALAGAVGKPVVVHVREADQACAEVLAEAGVPAAGGVIHCFTGDWERAKAYLDLGLFLSIAGVVTFRSAEDLRQAVKQIPLDRLMIETDSPYLAPIPHRGKRNEPAYVARTAEVVAELKGLSVEELGRVTGENARLFFGMG